MTVTGVDSEWQLISLSVCLSVSLSNKVVQFTCTCKTQLHKWFRSSLLAIWYMGVGVKVNRMRIVVVFVCFVLLVPLNGIKKYLC